MMKVWHQSGEKYFDFLTELTEVIYFNPHYFRHYFGRGKFAISKKASKFATLGGINLVCLLPGDPNLILFIIKKILFQKNARLIWHTSYPYYKKSISLKFFWIRLWLKIIDKYFECVITPIPLVKDKLNQKIAIDVHFISHPIKLYKDIDIDPRKDGKVVFGFLGEKTTKKGFDRFIKISETHSRYQFVAAGPDDNLLPNLPSNFKNYSQLNRKQVFKYLNTIDILLVPSRKTPRWEELFGIVIIEALSQNKKVIASKHMGPKFISSYSENLYLIDDNDMAWLQADYDAFLEIPKGDQNLEIFQLQYCMDEWAKIIGS
jgi:glycosyltransferase involved in cell wall biosynthesis